MKLSEPKVITFWISVVLALLGLIGYLVSIPVLSTLAFWLLLVGYVLLVLGLLIKGL